MPQAEITLSPNAVRSTRKAYQLIQGDIVLDDYGRVRGIVDRVDTVGSSGLILFEGDAAPMEVYTYTDVRVVNTGERTMAEATVPGTDVTVWVSVIPADPYRARFSPARGEDQWVAARTAQSDVCGHDSSTHATEAEARTAANHLWADTVARRDAPRF